MLHEIKWPGSLSNTSCRGVIEVLKKLALKHFDFVKMLIVDGATIGAFDQQLAAPSADLLFFNGLKSAIETGFMTMAGSDTQRLWGYVYFNQAKVKDAPLGFALFKGGGPKMVNEFWMAGIAPEFRQQGMGKLMFGELLVAEAKSNLMARCNQGSQTAMDILLKRGFRHVGTGKEGTRFLVDHRMEPKFQVAIRSTMPS